MALIANGRLEWSWHDLCIVDIRILRLARFLTYGLAHVYNVYIRQLRNVDKSCRLDCLQLSQLRCIRQVYIRELRSRRAICEFCSFFAFYKTQSLTFLCFNVRLRKSGLFTRDTTPSPTTVDLQTCRHMTKFACLGLSMTVISHYRQPWRIYIAISVPCRHGALQTIIEL